MTRLAASAVFALVILAGSSEGCLAQVQRSPYRRPSVSPYMNLLMPNDDQLPNYQMYVRPFADQRRRNQDFSRQISALQNAVVENTLRDQRGEAGMRPTGHQAAFMYSSHYFSSYHSHYFPTLNARRR